MTSVFEVRSRQWRASSFHRRGPFFAALFVGAGLAASFTGSGFVASSFAGGFSCAKAEAANSAIKKKGYLFHGTTLFS